MLYVHTQINDGDESEFTISGVHRYASINDTKCYNSNRPCSRNSVVLAGTLEATGKIQLVTGDG